MRSLSKVYLILQGLDQVSSNAFTIATVSDIIGLIIAVALSSGALSIEILKPSEKSNVTSTMDISFTSTYNRRLEFALLL